MGSLANWSLSTGSWNVTALADQFGSHARSWAGSAASWSGSAASQADEQARKWLATTTPAPLHRPGCLTTSGEAVKDYLTCNAALPNQFETQLEDRCNCLFQMHRTLEDANCMTYDHNASTGIALVQSQYGQISFDHGLNLKERCGPYWQAWLDAHPKPTLLQLAWDRFSLFASKHPGAAWFFGLLLLALLVVLILMCVRRTSWGRRVARSCYETERNFTKACVGEYKECVEDHPECCDGAEEDSRDVALQDGSDLKAQRSLKVYPDSDSDDQGDDGWHGIGYIVNSVAELLAPSEPEPDHYDMIQEGPSLAELHAQRDAEEQGISVVELQQRRRMAEQARQAQLAAQAAMYYNPPYHNPYSTTEDGHRVMTASPEVLQQSLMRSPDPQFLPASPSNTETPFPHRAQGSYSAKGFGKGGRQDLLV